jgi:hypothetical protein
MITPVPFWLFRCKIRDPYQGAEMIKKMRWSFWLLAMLFGGIYVAAEPMTAEQTKLLPGWAREKFATANKKYEVIRWIDPGLVHGDFNGDGKRDVSVLVRNRQNKKIGLAVVFRGELEPIVLGAGKEFGEAGDDFEWLTGWEMVATDPKSKSKADRFALAGNVTCSVVWDGKGFKIGPPVFETYD